MHIYVVASICYIKYDHCCFEKNMAKQNGALCTQLMDFEPV